MLPVDFALRNRWNDLARQRSAIPSKSGQADRKRAQRLPSYEPEGLLEQEHSTGMLVSSCLPPADSRHRRHLRRRRDEERAGTSDRSLHPILSAHPHVLIPMLQERFIDGRLHPVDDDPDVATGRVPVGALIPQGRFRMQETGGQVSRMDRSRGRLAGKLRDIEAEMRRIGFWDEAAPSFDELNRRHAIRSFLDAPSFEWWLQKVFLPNASRAVVEDRLPPASEVGEMARREYDYHSVVEEAFGLMRLLSEFDELVAMHAAGMIPQDT